MDLFWQYHPLAILIALCIMLVIALSNVRAISQLEDYPTAAADKPFVSILVPARNEAENIEACTLSLLEQDYPDFEVLVLDDHSTDETGVILRKLSLRQPRLHVLQGQPLPIGWMGKQWACHQLSQAAKGDYLLFTDADTRHKPDMVKHSVAAMQAERADMITAFPQEVVVTLGEKVVVPVIGFAIWSFMPMYLAFARSMKNLTVSIGQFMFMRRSVLETVGGYEAVRDQVIEDVMLGRKIIAQGYRWRLLNATGLVSCRMYTGFWQAVEGFSKNMLAFFNYHVSFYLLTWLVVGLIFLEPPFALFTWWIGAPLPYYPLNLAGLAVLQSLLLWWIAYRQFRLPRWLIIIYPLSLALFILVAMRSLVMTVTGQTSWKGRALERPEIHWL